MTDNAKKAKIVLISGTVGIIGVIFTIISDLILLGRPESGYSFFLLPTECMTWIPGWRITLGTFLGVFMLPFQIAGLVPLYIGLRPAGKTVPAVAGLTGAHGLVMGVSFHTTYAFLAGGWKLFHSAGLQTGLSAGTGAETGAGSTTVGSSGVLVALTESASPIAGSSGNLAAVAESANPIAGSSGNLAAVAESTGPSVMMRDFEFYWKLIIVIMVTELILLSILYVVTVLRGKSLFPKWMAVLNPAVIVAAVILILIAIPSPVGGYAAPTMLNLSNLTFFSTSSSVIYRKLKNEAVRA